MNPIVQIVDDFFPEPERVVRTLLSGEFKSVLNPVDDTHFPGIQENVPQELKDEFITLLHHRLPWRIHKPLIFARTKNNSTGGGPTTIHVDGGMGDFSAHVYLSDSPVLGAGTSFWEQDRRLLLVDWRFNRLLVHDAHAPHCAEPVAGWGKDASDGRLVLTAFFKLR